MISEIKVFQKRFINLLNKTHRMISTRGKFHTRLYQQKGSSFYFCSKHVHTTTQQVTDKQREHNGSTLFSHVSTGGANLFLSFTLYLFYFLIICTDLPFRPRHWQCTLPPQYTAVYEHVIPNHWWGWSDDNAPDIAKPLHWPLRFQRCICCR